MSDHHAAAAAGNLVEAMMDAAPAAAAAAASSAASGGASMPPMPRYSTRVKGAPSKLLDELIATPHIKKRRAAPGMGLVALGRPPKKGKTGSIERLYAYQANDAQRRQLAIMQQHPMFRMLPGMLPGMLPPPGFPLGGYPAVAAAAALAPTAVPTGAPAMFRPGMPPATTATASHVHAHAFPAVPIAPHAAMAHDADGEWMEESHPEDAARSSGELVSMLSATRCCALTPASFFVAWHGVLTLSFAGFPTPIAALKAELSALEGVWALPIEQSGSKWPKLTLACLRENRTLTVDQLRALYELTARFKERVRNDPWRMAVRDLSYVKFASRSQERILVRTDIPLKESLAGRATAAAAFAASAAASAAGGFTRGLPADVPPEESAKVNNVLAELSDAVGSVDTYLQHVNKPGGRVQHYQAAHSESSLVVFAAPARPHQATMARAPAFLEEFRQAVDQLLPEYYEWFPWSSLHCTVRTMA